MIKRVFGNLNNISSATFRQKTGGNSNTFWGLRLLNVIPVWFFSQRKYVLDILEEIDMLDCKLVDTPMDSNVKLLPERGELLRDPRRY